MNSAWALQTNKLLKIKHAQNDTDAEVGISLHVYCTREERATAEDFAKVYDNLDFQRGVQAFLTAMPGASLVAMRKGIRSFGPDNQTVIIFETLMDSRSLFLTANTESIYTMAWIDLQNGPVVIESPPNTLGIMDDFWFRYVTDMGNAGPDKGKGG